MSFSYLLLRFFTDVTKMLFFFTLKITEALVGCAVRLFYWSVRTYGWGQVGSFIAAAVVTVLLYKNFCKNQGNINSVFWIIIGTMIIYGLGWLLTRCVFRRMLLVVQVKASKEALKLCRVPRFKFIRKNKDSCWERFLALEYFLKLGIMNRRIQGI